MTEKLMVQEKEPLDIVARKIAEHAEQSEQSYRHIIEAALLVKKARRRVEAGEAGDVKWHEWALKNIKLPIWRLNELQQIARADDPKKEVERLRRLNQKRVEKHRKKKAKEQVEKKGHSDIGYLFAGIMVVVIMMSHYLFNFFELHL